MVREKVIFAAGLYLMTGAAVWALAIAAPAFTGPLLLGAAGFGLILAEGFVEA